jgi:hypothetical protein
MGTKRHFPYLKYAKYYCVAIFDGGICEYLQSTSSKGGFCTRYHKDLIRSASLNMIFRLPECKKDDSFDPVVT